MLLFIISELGIKGLNILSPDVTATAMFTSPIYEVKKYVAETTSYGKTFLSDFMKI
jgi:hypothetical protein